MNTETIGLVDIEQATRKYADARGDLREVVTRLNEAVEALKKKALPEIKRLVARAAERETALHGLIEQAPGLFERPRTVVFHGVKVGLQKGKGGITWDDDEKVVQLIEKHFSADKAELLIKTTKKPIAKAIEDLDVADLKRIGCRVEDSGDQVVIKPTDSAVDKVVNALLKDAVAEEVAP